MKTKRSKPAKRDKQIEAIVLKYRRDIDYYNAPMDMCGRWAIEAINQIAKLMKL